MPKSDRCQQSGLLEEATLLGVWVVTVGVERVLTDERDVVGEEEESQRVSVGLWS